jgi:hypothetical protein
LLHGCDSLVNAAPAPAYRRLMTATKEEAQPVRRNA